MEKLEFVQGKFLRSGFTTGTCAQAAAKAAAILLKTGKKESMVSICLPDGSEEEFAISEAFLKNEIAKCAVKKFAGDDPDITNGSLVEVSLERSPQGGIFFVAGEGVGVVVKEGLLIPKGEAAINPTPREYIKREVEGVFGEGISMKITISIPGGKELAAKTFNERIGVEGGLSILGTSGRVKPMSSEALKETILLEIKQKTKRDKDFVAIVLGNYGEKMAEGLGIPLERQITSSNYIGYAIDALRVHGVKKVYIIGHIAKLIKVSAGIFDTHSKVADARSEVMAARLLEYGNLPMAKEALLANTVEYMTNRVAEEKEYLFFAFLAEKIAEKIVMRSFGEMEAEVLLFGFKEGVLGYFGETFQQKLEEQQITVLGKQ